MGLNGDCVNVTIITQPENPKTERKSKEKDEEEEEKEEEEIEEEGENPKEGNLSPQEDLEKFLSEHEDYRDLNKMLKLGIPPPAVRQKALVNKFDMDIFEELLEKARKVYPKIN